MSQNENQVPSLRFGDPQLTAPTWLELMDRADYRQIAGWGNSLLTDWKDSRNIESGDLHIVTEELHGPPLVKWRFALEATWLCWYRYAASVARLEDATSRKAVIQFAEKASEVLVSYDALDADGRWFIEECSRDLDTLMMVLRSAITPMAHNLGIDLEGAEPVRDGRGNVQKRELASGNYKHALRDTLRALALAFDVLDQERDEPGASARKLRCLQRFTVMAGVAIGTERETKAVRKHLEDWDSSPYLSDHAEYWFDAYLRIQSKPAITWAGESWVKSLGLPPTKAPRYRNPLARDK